MSSMRAIVTIAVPAVTVLFGLLWYFRRRPPAAAQRSTDPPDKKVVCTSSSSNARSEVSNGTAGKSSANSEMQHSSLKLSENVVEEMTDIKVVKIKSTQDSAMTEKGDASDLKKVESLQKSVVKKEIEEVTVKQSFSEPSHSKVVIKTEKADDDQESVVKEEIVDDVVKQSFSEPTCSKVAVKTEPTDEATSESPVTVESSEQDIIAPIKVSTLQTIPTTASHGSKEVECTKTDSAENFSKSESQVCDSSHNLLFADLKEKLNESKSDVDKVTDTNSVLEDQVIQETPEPMSRSWYEDIPEESTFPDLGNSLSSDTSSTSPSKTKSNDVNNCDLQMDHASLDSEKNINQDASFNSQTKPVNDNVPATNRADRTSETNHSDSSSNCDSLSEASNDSGKGGSVYENVNHSSPDEERIFEFNIPSDMCGLFIGRSGKTIKMVSQQSATKIRLQNNPYTPKYQICVIEGTQPSIDCAISIIKRKFPAIRFPGPELTAGGSTMIMPEIMQLSLPEGVSVDIVVSSIVDAGRIFVQQPTHPSYTSLDRLNTFMTQCYMRDGSVPDIPRPIESGVICAAPMLNGWYRAQIMATHEDVDECDIKYVDYGGYSRVANSLLKQIRSDFMTLPFEAVECYMANITHLEYEQFFSAEAAVVLEELTQGKMLQARVVGHAEDGVPFVEIFLVGSHPPLAVNREMVQRGVVRWMEQLE